MYSASLAILGMINSINALYVSKSFLRSLIPNTSPVDFTNAWYNGNDHTPTRAYFTPSITPCFLEYKEAKLSRVFVTPSFSAILV